MRLLPFVTAAALAVAAGPVAAQQAAPTEPAAAPPPPVDASASAGVSTPEPVVAAIVGDVAVRGTMNLRSEVLGPSGIPLKYSEYGDGVSPPVAWDSGPPGTRSYVLVVEDPDAGGPVPFVHWIVYGIPAAANELPEGIASDLAADNAGGMGMRQGQNNTGSVGYFGMQPPPGTPPHNYYFQLFALDIMPDLPAGARKDEIVNTMRRHVLAVDTLIAPFGLAEALATTPDR